MLAPLLWLLLSLLCSIRPTHALAPVGNVPLGCILPLTGADSPQGLRAQAALTLLVADVNAGVAVGGFAANFMGLAPGQSLVLDCRDSQSEILVALRALHALKATHGSALVAVIGELSDPVTVALDYAAQAMGIMLVSPAATTPSLGQTAEHPYFIRTILGAETMAHFWTLVNDGVGWRRLTLITSDDDAGKGFSDVWLRTLADMKARQQSGNYTSKGINDFPYEVKSIVIPAEVSSTATAAIGQALDQLMASGVRVIQVQVGKQAETLMRMAQARGMVGEGPDGIIRQWIGDFCTEDFALAMQDNPGALFGSFCNMPSVPRTRADFPPTSPTAMAFEARMQAAYPALYPNGRHIDHLENAAGAAVSALVGVMGKTFAQPAMANTAGNFFSWLEPTGLPVTQPDGTSIVILPSGSAFEATVSIAGWDMGSRSFFVTGALSLASGGYEASSNTLIMASGSAAYPKDRDRIYVTSDELPVTFDGKMVVLAFVVVVLGAWTALILMEQALSFWSRAIWKQALGWVLLASVAFGACSVWPNTLMVYSSLTLDVDAKIHLQIWSIVVSAIYPMLMTVLAFFICMHSVDGGLKPAANVNVNEVSDISGNSSTTSASGSGTSTSHSASSVKSNMRQLKAGITRRLNKFREFLTDVTKRAGLQLVVASAVLAVLFVTQLMIVNAGMYVKAETAVQSGPIVGAAFFSWIVNVPALAMYFHVNRSGARYLSPFLLSISLLGSFFIIAKSSVWTYVKTRDISPAALEGKVVADSTLAAIVAVVCAAVCIALMAFNVNRLRMSRNVLDKVLTQVAGQVRGLESEIEYESEVRTALKEQGDFFRRSLEVINLCRPIWRPYAVAIALADPDDALAAAKAQANMLASTVAPLEKTRGAGVAAAAAAAAADKKNAARKTAVADNKASVVSSDDKDKDKDSAKADPVSGKAASKSKDKKKGAAGAEPSQHSDVGSATGTAAVSSIPGQILTPEHKTRTVKIASGTGSSSSGAAPAAASSSSSSAAASTPAAAQGPSDFLRVHAPKQEKQLAALLKEVNDLPLEGATPARTVADIRLPQILSHPVTLELMKDVLAKNLSPENIACWIDIQRYRTLEQTAVRKAVADEIFSTFIVSGAKYEVNLSSFMRDYIQTQVYKGSSSLDLFDEVEREIYRLMVTNNTEPLVQSTMFKLAAIVLQHPQFRLRSLTLANNVRGEIGGNVASTLGQVVQATSGSGGFVPMVNTTGGKGGEGGSPAGSQGIRGALPAGSSMTVQNAPGTPSNRPLSRTLAAGSSNPGPSSTVLRAGSIVSPSAAATAATATRGPAHKHSFSGDAVPSPSGTPRA